ncbi:MAG: hypothetical protein E7223_02080 [Clostridiales bacterium]|nr:hypothetical protein [Clostridiales bacterium]
MNLLTMSLSAALMAAVVVIVRFLLLHRLPKNAFLILWGLVLCRLLVPFSVPASLSLWPRLTALRPGGESLDFSVLNAAWPEAAVEGDAGTLQGGAESGLTAAAEGVSFVSVLYFAGLLLTAAWFICAYVRSLRQFRTAVPAGHKTEELAERFALRRRVRILETDRIKTPLTYGILRPVILLPGETDWQDRKGLAYVLAHEFAHIKRFDALLKLLLAAALCLHWFNPAVWMVYILANRDMELARDRDVLDTFGLAEREAYALTLIRWEEKRGRRQPLCSGFSRTAIEERITAIMKSKKLSKSAIVLAVVLVLGVTAVFAASGEPDPQSGTGLSGELSAAGKTSGEGGTAELNWVWPGGENQKLSAEFLCIHPITGENMLRGHVNIIAESGDPVFAALSGTVLETGYNPEDGYYILLEHSAGLQTAYTHLETILTEQGDLVKGGSRIGTVGTTGMATGPNLGFQVLVSGEATDPMAFFE